MRNCSQIRPWAKPNSSLGSTKCMTIWAPVCVQVCIAILHSHVRYHNVPYVSICPCFDLLWVDMALLSPSFAVSVFAHSSFLKISALHLLHLTSFVSAHLTVMFHVVVAQSTQIHSRMAKHNVNAWLINTGWTGGAFGAGHRMSLKDAFEMQDKSLTFFKEPLMSNKN